MRYSTQEFACYLCAGWARECLVLADDEHLWFCHTHREHGADLERMLHQAYAETSDFAQASGLIKIILDLSPWPALAEPEF